MVQLNLQVRSVPTIQITIRHHSQDTHKALRHLLITLSKVTQALSETKLTINRSLQTILNRHIPKGKIINGLSKVIPQTKAIRKLQLTLLYKGMLLRSLSITISSILLNLPSGQINRTMAIFNLLRGSLKMDKYCTHRALSTNFRVAHA